MNLHPDSVPDDTRSPIAATGSALEFMASPVHASSRHSPETARNSKTSSAKHFLRPDFLGTALDGNHRKARGVLMIANPLVKSTNPGCWIFQDGML